MIVIRWVKVHDPKIIRRWLRKAIEYKWLWNAPEHKTSGMPGTSRDITTNNMKKHYWKLELKNFNPIFEGKDDTVHKEIK